ncbi:MAG: hypothetical protein CMJ83_13225 [Planctomycetes bacterium]|nr:hypothetical protein [Planctomycetota bacterium]
MLGFVRKLLTYLGLPAAFLGVLFVGGFLQEFAGDELPEAARTAGSEWPLPDPWIEVNIQKMTLTLMDGDRIVKRYDIGYGRGAVGRLVDRTDSTPLGEYTIIEKRKRKDIATRGSRFLLLDYPSESDADAAFDVDAISNEEYEAIQAAHRAQSLPPPTSGLGGSVGIQGNYWFFMDRRFTDGSVAMSNGDVNELYEHVSVGTRVVIRAR